MTPQNKAKWFMCHFSHYWEKIPSRINSEEKGIISAHIFMMGKE